jgi:hypothetical protein
MYGAELDADHPVRYILFFYEFYLFFRLYVNGFGRLSFVGVICDNMYMLPCFSMICVHFAYLIPGITISDCVYTHHSTPRIPHPRYHYIRLCIYTPQYTSHTSSQVSLYQTVYIHTTVHLAYLIPGITISDCVNTHHTTSL